MMHSHEQSRSAIVAVKPTNKVERSAAEPVERRAEAEGKVGQQSTYRAQYRAHACQRRWLAYGTLLPWIPEVGTVCGKAACTDLCGGPPVMEVPTATAEFMTTLIEAKVPPGNHSRSLF